MEQRLKEERLEEEKDALAVLMEGEKEERLESSRRGQESWQRWYYYLQDEKLVRSLNRLELEEVIVMEVDEVSLSMKTGRGDKEEECLAMEMETEVLEMVTEEMEDEQIDESWSLEMQETVSVPDESIEEDECICAVNCTECQSRDANMPEVGKVEQNDECIYSVHCSGPRMEGKNEQLCLKCDNQPGKMGSVVGVESNCEYPPHYGGGHTPLLSPAIITEKGVELGWVIGLSTTGEQDIKSIENIAAYKSITSTCIEENIEDIKYCPGGELPVYKYMEYKPRCSKSRRVHYQHRAPVFKKESECPDLGGPIHARVEGDGGGDRLAQGQDADHRGGGVRHGQQVGGDPENRDVRSLISAWEDMDTGGGGGLEAVLLSAPGGAGSGRRVSREFENLRGKFEKLGEGETSGPGCALTSNLKQENMQTSFSTLCMGKVKQRARAGVILERENLFSIFTAKTVRGGMPLAKPSANRKRGGPGNNISEDNPKKKMKV